MKILQTPGRFYPYIGGVENYVYCLSKELLKLGHEVKVVCADEPEIGSANIEGINVTRLRYIAKIANTNITLFLPAAIYKEKFDIVHTHLPTPWSADWSAVISFIKNKPLILNYYNNIVGKGIYAPVAAAYNSSFLYLLLRVAKKVIINNKKYLEYAPILRCFSKKIEVVPIVVDTQRFKPEKKFTESKCKNIFFLSLLDKFHRYKGLNYLIRALSIVKEKIPDVKLIVGGEGSLKFYYKQLASYLNLEKYIKFVGFLPDKKLVDYYNFCDVFVLPSVSSQQEGFGIVLLEAMACAKPVVATDITGPAERIKERGAGIIIEPRNINALATAIIEILKDSDYALEMGMRARRLIEEEFSWDASAQIIEKIYLEVLRIR